MRYLYRRKPFRGRMLLAAGVMLAALMTDAALAEPAHADAAASFASAPARTPRAIESFSIAGADVSFTASGRNAYADTGLQRDHIRDARAMDKVMPGYPQPAFVTFDMRIWF